MSSIEDASFLDTLRSEAKLVRPGILPKDTKFDSYIGHTVINLSNTTLDQPHIKALQKSLTFYPTPGLPDKSQMWLDFKEFHRRLELVEFFNRDNTDKTDPLQNQSIIDFMNNNTQDESAAKDMKFLKNKKKMCKPKSGWKPSSPPPPLTENFRNLSKICQTGII